ncbi:MAG TPA: hypothetical protein VIV06_06545, partial [Candidatus Limnocylindrales bacterium]
EFTDGVYFVPLDTVTDPQLIASAIIEALGVESGTDPPFERIVRHLRERHALLVLDNFEQVVGGASIVARLLQEAPAVKLVVTSRIVLRISGEQELGVPPLGLPEPGASPEAIERSEAVRLFAERASAAQPSFRVDAANAPIVADIVSRLDGLPLAIELAAARVRVLPLPTLQARLHQRLSLLIGGPRELPGRQQTLRGAIDWSYDLLEASDRPLFERFGVCAGGACLAEAEEVCAPGLDGNVLDGLASLSEKSLVRPVPGPEDEPRFAMLATIREYALERLGASGEDRALHDRHADAYLRLVEHHAPGFTGPLGRHSLDRLAIDHENVRSAFDWLVESGDAERVVRLVTGMWRFWQIRGHLQEGDRRVERALAMPELAALSPELRARMYGSAGSIAYWRGDFPRAHRMYRRALDAALGTASPAMKAEANYNLGFAPRPDVLAEDERYQYGRPFWDEALALYRATGDEGGAANVLWALAIALIGVGDLELSRSYSSEALRVHRQRDDWFGMAWALHLLGTTEIALADSGGTSRSAQLHVAEGHLREGMELFLASGDNSGILLLLLDFVLLARAKGDQALAWRLAGATESLRRATGADLVVASPIERLGWVMPTVPDDPAARREWDLGMAMKPEAAAALATGSAQLSERPA